MRYIITLFLLSFLVSACGDRLSTQEAYDTCEKLSTDTAVEGAFADCVDCYERCGNECDTHNGEPPDVYACPEDLEGD